MSERLFTEIKRILSTADMSSLPTSHVSVLRNVVVEAVEPYLRHAAYEDGVDLRLRFGEFDNVVQEALGANEGLLAEETSSVLVFLQLASLSPSLGRDFAGCSSGEIEDEVERVRGLIRTVLSGIRDQAPAMILWHGFETPLFPSRGIVDGNDEAGQTAAIAGLNGFLREELGSRANAYFVDFDRLRARIGGGAFYDLRYWHIGRAPWSRAALAEIAREDYKFLRSLGGMSRKCLVLDCDNVLWGGVVGEDGLAGIRLGRTHPGSPYHEFQREVLGLYHRGVILALNSKNDEEDVWEVFDHHPDMVLKREHIAAHRINWQDKAANLRELVAELNIGMRSVVFADDSEFEVDLVRTTLPEVLVLHLPPDRAIEHAGTLAAAGVFDTLTLSEEDRKRGEMYRAESERRHLRDEATDLEGYYRSLEMEVEIRFADELSIPRIAQLTQKTNQFNLTTRRYSEEDVRRLSESPASDVICLRLLDRFGDSGIVGVCILEYEEGKAVFDSFLMSCRVLGRRVEEVFVARCLECAIGRGSRTAIGLYSPTKKNRMASGFFDDRSFRRVGDDEETRRFEMDLSGGAPSEPSFFKRIESDVDAGPELNSRS